MPDIKEFLPYDNDGGSLSAPTFRGRFVQHDDGLVFFEGIKNEGGQFIEVELKPMKTNGLDAIPNSFIMEILETDLDMRITLGMNSVTFEFYSLNDTKDTKTLIKKFRVDREVLFT
ncbi:MAG: hypothetical protein AAB656_03285 [Patescibacteria group bacterium]